jgi:hypothetical protein
LLLLTNKKLFRNALNYANNINKLSTQLNETEISYKDVLKQLKEPFSLEHILPLIGEHQDKAYENIRNSLIQHFVDGNSYVFSSQNNEESELVKLLRNYGIQSGNNVSISVDVNDNFQWKIDFKTFNDNESSPSNSYFKREYEAINGKVSFSFHCSGENIFYKHLVEDSDLFVKSYLMGYVKKLIEDEKYDFAKKIIKENELTDGISPYIKNNMNNSKVIAFFSDLI